MLIEADRSFVETEILGFIAVRPNPRETIIAHVGFAPFAENFGEGVPRELVFNALKYCVADAWNNDPPLLVRLIDIIPDMMRITRLKEIRERVLSPPPPPDPALDPLNAMILGGNVPFVNRVDLRSKLSQFATMAGRNRPILVISGDPKTGKSYTSRYIDHFLVHNHAITPYLIEFDPDLGPEMGARELATDMVALLGRPTNTVPEDSTNSKRYVQDLVNWVLGEAMQYDPYHWFILDNFKGNELRSDTRDFLVALADTIVKGRFPQACRLILIGFEKALLTVNPGRLDEENITLASEDDVAKAIEEALKRSTLNIDPETVTKLLFPELPDGAERMPEISNGFRAFFHASSQVRAITANVPGIVVETVIEKMVESLPSGDEKMKVLQTRLDALRTTAGKIV